MSTLTAKQKKDLLKAERLMLQVQELFNSAVGESNWCPMKGQTENSIDRASDLLKSFVNYKLNN